MNYGLNMPKNRPTITTVKGVKIKIALIVVPIEGVILSGGFSSEA
jgi:hypothetical protein